MAQVFPWIALGLLAAVLAVAAVTDWRTGKIYNWLTYPAILAGLALATLAGLAVGGGVRGALAGLGDSLLAAGLALVLVGIALALGGLGWGDAKLMTAVGAITASWQCVLTTAMNAVLIAFAMAVLIMVRHGLVRRTLGRIFGAALSALARVKPDLPQDSPRVPFGVAIALGAVPAALEQLLKVRMPWSWI